MLLTSQHEMLRDTVRAFAAKELAPNAARWDKESHFPREELRSLGALGLFAVAVGEEWNGAGMDYTALALAIEEISAGDGATSTIISVTNLVAGILNGFGSSAQKEAYLRPLARGDLLGAFCLTEASMAKLFASEMAEKVCSDAIQVHGGYGYVADFPVERIWRDVRVCKIYEGASDIQRLVIGRALAG